MQNGLEQALIDLLDRIAGKVRANMDLAVTKAGRFQDHDKADIELMARAGLLDSESFRQRATEALDYLATDPSIVRINIDEATELIAEASSDGGAESVSTD